MTLAEKFKEYLEGPQDTLRAKLIKAVSLHQGWEESAIAIVDDAIIPVVEECQARVKELEVELEADKQLIRNAIEANAKLEVARNHAIQQDCGRMCDSDPKLNYREQYERSTAFVDKLIEQALTATETASAPKTTEGDEIKKLKQELLNAKLEITQLKITIEAGLPEGFVFKTYTTEGNGDA